LYYDMCAIVRDLPSQRLKTWWTLKRNDERFLRRTVADRTAKHQIGNLRTLSWKEYMMDGELSACKTVGGLFYLT